MDKRLHVVANQELMGEIVQRGNRLTFTYDEDWRARNDAMPLSLSMPLTAGTYPDRVISPYLWNLLPDNDRILRRWAQRFHVSPRNPFALLEHVGEDIAGAAQLVRPERLDFVLGRGKNSGVEWISEEEIGQRLHDLLTDESAWSREGDAGYFSLSGAQPKLALLHRKGKWGIATGRTPTTHILKPPGMEFDGHAQNEHFCLTLAREINLPVATSSIQHFDGRTAIVVERFDRIQHQGEIIRIAAEDLCQALGIHPAHKYQRDGGPGPLQIIELIRRESSSHLEDQITFLDALAFNWLVGGTDAHAKNYSLLLGHSGRVRLAPLYDIASAIPYRAFDPRRLKLAMKIGSHYELKDVNAHDWEKLGAAIKLGMSLPERVGALAAMLPDLVAQTARALKEQGLTHAIIDRMAKSIHARIKSAALRLPSATTNWNQLTSIPRDPA